MPVIGAFEFGDLIVNHAELRGRAVLTNGLESVRKYNPASGNWLPVCLRPFRQNPVFAAGGAGVLNGDYVYRIVPYNINEDEEGEAFPITGEDDAAFQIAGLVNQSVNINLAGLRIDSPEITHVRIYRTVDGGVWPALALVGEEAIPFGVFNDNVDDDDLDFTNEGLDTLARVPTPKPYICQHDDRLFMVGDIPYSVGEAIVTNGNDVIQPAAGAVWGFWLEGKEFHFEGDARTYIIDEYDPVTGNLTLTQDYEGATDQGDYRICGDPDSVIWCEPGFEWQWPAANERPIGGKEADKATGIMSDAGRLIIGKSGKIYQLTYSSGFPQVPYSHVGLITDQFGVIAHRSMRHAQDVPTMQTKEGIAQVLGGTARVVSHDATEWWKAELQLAGNGEQQFCFSVLWPAKQQYLAFIKSNDAQVGADKALVWHYATNRFTTYEFLTEFVCGELVKDSDGEDIIVLGDVNGYVWEFPYGDIDGAPVNSTLVGNVDEYITGLGSPDYCAIVDTDAQFPTSGLGLAGVPLYIYSGKGAGQSVIIIDNTTDTLFIPCFDIAPDETSRYYIGTILALYRTGWEDFGTLAQVKRATEAFTTFRQEDHSDLRFRVYKDFEATAPDMVDERLSVDLGLLDLTIEESRMRVKTGGIQGMHLAWEVEDGKPDNPFSLYDVALRLNLKEG